jgi:hypothetical protein
MVADDFALDHRDQQPAVLDQIGDVARIGATFDVAEPAGARDRGERRQVGPGRGADIKVHPATVSALAAAR